MKRKAFLLILTLITTIAIICLSASCFAPEEVPTLELEVYDGPDYSESDNMCYYRVEAKTTGMPDPEIVFEDEDNISLISSDRVKVGVKPGDSYTLSVIAANSAGSANFSIILKGECDELPSEIELVEEDTSAEEVDPVDIVEQESTQDSGEETKEEVSGSGEEKTDKGPPPDELTTQSLILLTDLSGSVGWELDAIHDYIVIGDYEDNVLYKGILSFDISGLRGETIDSAELNITTIWNTPGDVSEMGPLTIEWIKTSHEDRLVDEDYHRTTCGVVAEHDTTGGLFSINESGDLLTWAIQNAIDLGWDNFQLEFSLRYLNLNGIEDQLRFDFVYADLIVVY